MEWIRVRVKYPRRTENLACLDRAHSSCKPHASHDWGESDLLFATRLEMRALGDQSGLLARSIAIVCLMSEVVGQQIWASSDLLGANPRTPSQLRGWGGGSFSCENRSSSIDSQAGTCVASTSVKRQPIAAIVLLVPQ